MATNGSVFQIRDHVEWFSQFDNEGNQWLAVCPSLNLNAYGDTYADMVECAQSVTQSLWEVLLEDGDLEEFLCARGMIVETRKLPPATGGEPRPRVDLPYRLTPTDGPLPELATV